MVGHGAVANRDRLRVVRVPGRDVADGRLSLALGLACAETLAPVLGSLDVLPLLPLLPLPLSPLLPFWALSLAWPAFDGPVTRAVTAVVPPWTAFAA